MKMKKGDLVRVIYGAHKGKSGRLTKVMSSKNQAVVAGVNLVKRKSAQNSGPVQEVAKPLDFSKLALVCPNCQKATRLGYKFEGQIKVRFCKKCQTELR